MKRLFALTAAVALAFSLNAQNYNALRFKSANTLFNYEMMAVHEANQERAEALEQALKSKAQMEQYCRQARERLTKLCGPLPERTKMKAQTVGRVKCDGYNIEKVVMQSAPGRYVTAHLYLPADAKGRVPACVEMCGHGLSGKGRGSLLAELMATNGIAVMVVDPIGQGERQQTIDGEGRNLTRGVTTEHTLLAPAYMLLGTNLAAQEYYDNSRAIDYLQTRSDIDPDRIGCYGFSGGGTQAAYLIGLDERVKAGCVGLFFSSRERTLETQGPSDGCQWMPGEGRERIEITDMALMNAPRPFLVLDGLYDFVDHWGALRGFDELKRAYTVLGCPDRVDQYYCEDGHATPPDVRDRMVRFFRHWLLDDDSAPRDAKPYYADGMDCTGKGQVKLEYADAKSTMQACAEAMDALATEREAFCNQPIAEVRRQLASLLALPDLSASEVEIVATGESHQRDVDEYRYQLNRRGEMPVPVVVRVPFDASAQSAITLRLSDKGKAAVLGQIDATDPVSDGNITVVADLRGVGETADGWQYNLSKYWNREYRLDGVGFHAGRPMTGQRVADVITLLDFCAKEQRLSGRKVNVEADGASAVAVAHAAVIDDRVSSAHLTGTVKTWRSFIDNPVQRDMMATVVPGALRHYDLPDLLRLCQGRVSVDD